MKEIELKELVENSSGRDKINALLEYSNLFRQSDVKKSCDIAEQAKRLAIEVGDKVLEANAMISQAYAYFYDSDFESAQRITNELIQVGMKYKNNNALGTSYNIKGRIAFKSLNPALATEHNLKALKYYLKDPSPINLLSCYNNLGQCQQHIGNNDEALNYYQLALDEANKINHPASQVILQNIGTIQYLNKNYDAALEAYQKAVIYFEENMQFTNLANANYNIGLTYQQLGDYEKSIASFNTAYEIQKEINDPKGFSYTCNSIAQSLIEMDELEKAYKLLQKSYQIAKEYDLKWNLKITSETMADYWETVGDLKKALKYLKEVMALSKELDQEVNKTKLQEMEAKYKTRIYKFRSQKLNDENKSMSEQIATLQAALHQQRDLYENLQNEFQQAASKINQQDDLLSSQSRMAVMGEMISLISHQWRQPLNTIGVLVQSFQDAWAFDELSEEFIVQQVDIVMNQIMYMSETINDFQDFFKIKMAEHFNLKDAILKAGNLLDFAFQKGSIDLITDFECECPLQGVQNDIVQVIINILNNARQAMMADKIQNPLIKITLTEKDDHACIKIYNKGNNIPTEVLPKLFEPYFTTRVTKGTGIGLYICQMIVENKFKGNIYAQNLPDGVEFSILLPLSTNL